MQAERKIEQLTATIKFSYLQNWYVTIKDTDENLESIQVIF